MHFSLLLKRLDETLQESNKRSFLPDILGIDFSNGGYHNKVKYWLVLDEDKLCNGIVASFIEMFHFAPRYRWPLAVQADIFIFFDLLTQQERKNIYKELGETLKNDESRKFFLDFEAYRKTVFKNDKNLQDMVYVTIQPFIQCRINEHDSNRQTLLTLNKHLSMPKNYDNYDLAYENLRPKILLLEGKVGSMEVLNNEITLLQTKLRTAQYSIPVTVHAPKQEGDSNPTYHYNPGVVDVPPPPKSFLQETLGKFFPGSGS